MIKNDLLTEIEKIDVGNNNIRIYFLGQAGYVIKTPKAIIYIDPYLSDFIENQEGLGDERMRRKFSPPINPARIRKLDAIYVTHGHYDHMDPWTLNNITVKYRLFCTKQAYIDNSQLNINSKNVTFLNPKLEYKTKDITVMPILSAHNELNSSDPYSVSLVVKARNKTLFFWGDGIIYNELLDVLKTHNYDYFFAPINGRDWFRERNNIIGNINSRELSVLSNELTIDVLVPNHFDMFDINSENPDHFIYYLNKENPSQRFKIVKCGGCIEA